MSSEPSTSVSTPLNEKISSPISLNSEGKSPDDIISEKSAKLKEWVKQRLQDLEDQNLRLIEQNRRCTNQLKALTSFAEKNKQSRQSLLFSQSVTGVLPVIEMFENRTSDDSGLTSDETSGDNRKQPPTTLNILTGNKRDIISTNDTMNFQVVDLMTQSTSALLKRSPRQQRRIPKTNGNLTLKKATIIENKNPERENQSPTTTDSSPCDDKPKMPIPAPRKKIHDNTVSTVKIRNNSMEKDSLNSYNNDIDDDDYNEYEEEDDEIFDEIESPLQYNYQELKNNRNDYVNLTEYNTNNHIYSDIIKTAPELPKHQPLRNFEEKLCRTAEKCLSINADDIASTSGEQNGNYLSTPKRNFIRTSTESKRHPSSQCSIPSRGSHSDSGFGRSSTEQQNHISPINRFEKPPEGMVLAHPPISSPISRKSSDMCDYAIPPDANRRNHRNESLERLPTVRASVIPQSDQEMSGYLTVMSENRLRSLKRRYVVLKNAQLKFYRTHKQMLKEDSPLLTINIRDIKTVTKVNSKSGGLGMEIVLENENLRYQAESDKTTEEWFNTLTLIIKNLTIADLASRSKPLEADLGGWIIRVRHGHQKRYYAKLIGDKLLLFKKSDDKIPTSQQNMRGARITEKTKCSSDEYSASSGDEHNDIRNSNNGGSSSIISNTDNDYSICIEAVDSDPQYIILNNSEDKDKWLYYLKLSSKDATMCGTSFEILIERLMTDIDPINSKLWNDILFKSIEPQQTETLIKIDNNDIRKKALELDLACYLFTSVQIKPIAIQYHVDLCQNILTTAIESSDLQNELYCQLIRLTSGSMEYGYQAWKLLSMAIPLYLPKQYSLLWLLKQHIERYRRGGITKESKMAEYCYQTLLRRSKINDRLEGPSKLETLTFMTRDATNLTLPYSIAIKLPTGDHQIIEFDGSTEIGTILSNLCLKLNLRPALLSGYSIYANDPTSNNNDDYVLLKGKQKLCDCLTIWEKQMKDIKSGKITTDTCTIKLELKLKNYWLSLSDDETLNEKLFLCYRMAQDIVKGYLPLSNELSEELCAIYSQMYYGDYNSNIDDKILDDILNKFYPNKLLKVVNIRSVKESIITQWNNQLKNVTINECVRLILIVLKKWKFFGAYIKEAKLKINDKTIYIALNENGIHLLSEQLDIIRSIQFYKLINFGEYNGDFMLTVSRTLPPNAHPEETPRERLTFAMDKKSIKQLTTHLAEYIRCQKLLWKMSRK